jgi:uncharacterized protein (DUF58 family)
MAFRWWPRLDAALDTRVRQRVTRAGWVYTLVIVWVGLAAFVSANNLLFLLLATMLATLLISGFVSRLGLAGLVLEVNLPGHIPARQKVRARFDLYNEKRWMPAFSIHLTGAPPTVFASSLYFPAVPCRTRLRETIEVEFARRGLYRENGFEVWTRFPFGFTERRLRVQLKWEFVVYPSLQPQPGFDEVLRAITGEIETHLRGRGSDFYRIRPYEALESARHVDWRASAHTGELQVREFAREQDPMLEIYLDLAVTGRDLEWFEWAVSCCAYLVWNALERECRVRFCSQECDYLLPVEQDVYAVLRYLALVAPRPQGRHPRPGEEHACHVVLTARPGAAEEAGWGDALIITPADVPPDALQPTR